ncbi:filament-like plant protein 3 isoform X2 [Eurytemora carolleeae]|uniref:filament-like plant protein 3 isoform X2 n=1 Tax=Eurytemora carolleeae TaxID=1294199 RepID=UPI000C78696C|nr:filament-like plant protein 3 isoform X2 [Eurytemora carolleeae]|eukprot:XP_023331639.1 filament-like plant protein 3 isoform X2 [Eurytemora affinis]
MADEKKAATAEKKVEPVESKSVYTICNFLYLSVHISLFVILVGVIVKAAEFRSERKKREAEEKEMRSSLEETIQTQKSAIDTLNLDLAQVAERIETTAKNYQDKDKIIASKDKEIKRLTKELEAAQKSEETLKGDLAATSASLELKQEAVKECEVSNQESINKIKALETSLDKSTKTTAETKKQLETTAASLDQGKSKISELEKKVNLLQGEKEALSKGSTETKALREKVQALEGEKGGIIKENGELKQKVGILETSISAQAKQIQEKDEDIKKKAETLVTAQKASTDCNNQLTALRTEKEEKERNIASLTQKFAELEKKSACEAERLATATEAKNAAACKEREAACLNKQAGTAEEAANARKQVEASAATIKSKTEALEASTKKVEELSNAIKQCQTGK